MPANSLLEQGEKRRDQIMRFVKKYMAKHGYSPSISEIGEAVGVSSPNAVRNHLHKLRDDGRIDITPRVARSIRILEE